MMTFYSHEDWNEATINLLTSSKIDSTMLGVRFLMVATQFDKILVNLKFEVNTLQPVKGHTYLTLLTILWGWSLKV